MTATVRRVTVKGHAWVSVQTNVYGDKRFLCECGGTGSPLGSQEDARAEHRIHKLQVSTPHHYRKAKGLYPPECALCGQTSAAPVHAA